MGSLARRWEKGSERAVRRTLLKALLILVYGVMVFAPVLLLFVGPRPPQREFWREFSVALGFAAMALLGLQFVPPARLPFLARAFPLDVLYRFHHLLSVTAFVLAAAHPVILFINNPYTLGLLNLFTAPWRARAAVVALLAMAVLVVSSVWRQELKVDYDIWHILHGIAALLASGLALYHMIKVNYHMARPLQRGIWAGLAVLWVSALLYARLIRPWLLLRRPYVVRDVQAERGETWSLILEPVGHAGITFRPGQVAWLTIDGSPFYPNEHPFSIASSAEHPEQISFAIRELGDFTSTIGQTSVGQTVYVDGPYGVFDIDDFAAPRYVLIAGGIGSAPVMGMLRTMADRDDQTPVLLIYGNRTWDGVIFREELEDLERSLNLQVVHVLERPPEWWTGESGFVTRDLLDRHLPECRREAAYFLCGPLPMIKAVTDALGELDIPRARVHTEEYRMA